MLFNEPKLLKFLNPQLLPQVPRPRFSALQRAEIAEICRKTPRYWRCSERFSALQRAEIAEIAAATMTLIIPVRFSALQRAEIAEMIVVAVAVADDGDVSVLFNEPKLLKSPRRPTLPASA